MILNYGEDSLSFRQLFYDLADPTYDYGIASLKLGRGTERVLAGPSKKGTFFQVTHHKDSIKMIATDDSLYKYTFEPSPTYAQAKYKKALEKILISSTMALIDSADLESVYRVEFLNSGRVVSQSFKFGDYAVWSLETYNGELFLVFDGFTGGVFHIKGISGSKFSSVTYGLYGRQFSWEAKPVVKRFDQSLLPGAWVEDMGEEYLDMYVELINKDYKSYQPPELFIDSVRILEAKSSRIDTLHWEGNREGDLIEMDLAYWTIDSLTQEIFVFSQRKSGGVKTRRFVRK